MSVSESSRANSRPSSVPRGPGKTTIISLIPRFYNPDSGAVKIDGIDVKYFAQRSLRNQISFVLQETVLFQGPVWQNIAYEGKPGASRAGNLPRRGTGPTRNEFIGKNAGSV